MSSCRRNVSKESCTIRVENKVCLTCIDGISKELFVRLDGWIHTQGMLVVLSLYISGCKQRTKCALPGTVPCPHEALPQL